MVSTTGSMHFGVVSTSVQNCTLLVKHYVYKIYVLKGQNDVEVFLGSLVNSSKRVSLIMIDCSVMKADVTLRLARQQLQRAPRTELNKFTSLYLCALSNKAHLTQSPVR